MALPGMRERVMRIGSAGKTFSLTGWKIGYVTAPAAIAEIVAKAHQNLTFTTPPNLQRAVAIGLAREDAYFAALGADLAARRDRLAAGLAGLGMRVLATHGSYFLIADVSALGFPGDDAAFCRHITARAGVAAIPVSAFYAGPPPRNYIRFAFCKRPEVLDAAISRLAAHFAAPSPAPAALTEAE
jgi:aspartate/methionine/tyrosine aminotransferase